MLSAYLAVIKETPDKVRFEHLYNSCRKQMLAVAHRILKNMPDAEDAVQDALLGVARNIGSLRQISDDALRAYAMTAAKHSALKILQHNRKNESAVRDLEMDYSVSDSVFQSVLNSLDSALLLRAMRQLDPIYRDVMLLIFVQEHTVGETADILGRKEETVRKQLQRGKKILIDLCRKEGLNYGEG